MIKGFIGTSLLDFPGNIASIIFVGGCNFCCPYCHNYQLVSEDCLKEIPSYSQEEVLRELQQRKGFIDGVVITGGEPLLVNNLEQLMEEIRRLGLAIKIDSNGYFPDRLQDLLDSGLVNYVALDIKSSWEKYSIAAGKPVDIDKIKSSVSKLMNSNVLHEFRTTVVPELVEKEDILAISRAIAGASTFVLQQYNPLHVQNPIYRALKPFPVDILEYYAQLAEEHVNKVIIRI